MGSLLQQQPPPERHDRNGYSVMLKLFRSVKRDNQATAQTELVAALRKAAKLPATLFCIAESGRNLNSLRYIETLFDNEVTLRFILEKGDLFFPPLEFQKNSLLQSFAGIVRKFEVESIQQTSVDHIDLSLTQFPVNKRAGIFSQDLSQRDVYSRFEVIVQLIFANLEPVRLQFVVDIV